MNQQVLSTSLPILILGLGWTGQFLVELLTQLQIAYAATTRDGRNNTIQWTLTQNNNACSDIDVTALPLATTVLVTFPVLFENCMNNLMNAYESRYGQGSQWILLSSTRPFTDTLSNRHGTIDPSKDTSGRTAAETVILNRGGTVLHLAGLWGAQRHPRNWVPRFASKDAIRAKLLARQLHLIHGQDLARAIVAVHEQFKPGERWIVTGGGCSDWIRLFLAWGSPEQIEMARRLAQEDEECHRVLGNDTLEEIVARGGVVPRLDSREFWDTFGLQPTQFLELS